MLAVTPYPTLSGGYWETTEGNRYSVRCTTFRSFLNNYAVGEVEGVRREPQDRHKISFVNRKSYTLHT